MKFKDKTRGGYRWGLYATDADGTHPNHGWVVEIDGGRRAHDWTRNGRYRLSGAPHPYDLLPLREPSEAAVEAAIDAVGLGKVLSADIRAILTAAYEIDFPEGGK